MPRALAVVLEHRGEQRLDEGKVLAFQRLTAKAGELASESPHKIRDIDLREEGMNSCTTPRYVRDNKGSCERGKRRLPGIALGTIACLIAVACQADTPDESTKISSNSANGTEAKVRALLDKTLKNLRFIEGGSFMMGDFGPLHSPDKLPYSSATDNKFLHKVTLDSFSMSAYKTTYADHDVYSEATGRPKVGMDDLTRNKLRHAESAAGLKWQQARDYCQWLGKQLNLPMDLPSEAQWEYAARNRGQFLLFATDNGKSEPGRNVWEYEQRQKYADKHSLHPLSPSLPLGHFPPNALGLHDMMTDGFEWVLDWYAPDYYKSSPAHNPPGPAKGKEKVLRSSSSRDGEGLSHGDGMTFTRSHRHPAPAALDWNGKPDPGANMTTDTTARCVVNSAMPISRNR
jgi:formylglycine-generating enzyme required for sulfatase activity